MDSPLPHINGQAITLIVMVGWALIAKLVGARKSAEAPPAPTDEQTRRVQEEIRRKILLRRAEAQAPARPLPPPLAAPRPIATPIPETLRQILDARIRAREQADKKTWQVADATPAPPSIQDAAPVVIPAGMGSRLPEPRPGDQPAATLRGDLRDPEALRRAFILREVLSPPLALR